MLNTAVTKLTFDGAEFTVEYEGDASHLDDSISTLARQNWWRKDGKQSPDVNLRYRPIDWATERDLYLEARRDAWVNTHVNGPEFLAEGFLADGAAVFPLDPDGERLLKLLEEEFLYAERFHRLAGTGYFAALLARLARGGASGADRRDEFLTYILAHYTEDLTYEHMGEVFHYHPNYISQVVREKTGLPLRRYLLRLRVRQASQLLLDRDLPVEEVAALVGFRDVSYFVQYFKKTTGMTPLHYRQNKKAE